MNVVRNSFFPSFLQKPLTLLRKIPIFQRFEESVFTSYVSHGKLVGADTFGNTYYEQSQPETTAHCRERYVIYANYDFDASQIPPNWHAWLHKTKDVFPVSDFSKLDMSQIRSNPEAIVLSKVDSAHSIYQKSPGYQGFQTNLTGTDGRYIPYSTTKPKIEKWDQVIS